MPVLAQGSTQLQRMLRFPRSSKEVPREPFHPGGPRILYFFLLFSLTLRICELGGPPDGL